MFVVGYRVANAAAFPEWTARQRIQGNPGRHAEEVVIIPDRFIRGDTTDETTRVHDNWCDGVADWDGRRLARGAAAAGARRTAALFGRQPPRHADQPGADGAFKPMSVEREGLRRDLLGRELFVRPGARRDRGAEPRRRRRTCRPTTPGSRSSTTTARCTPRAGSASRTPASSAANMTHAAGPERAARQRHRQRHPLPRRSRRRHEPQRSGRVGRPQLRHADRRAGRRDHASRNRTASTTSRWPTTARSTRRRPASGGQTPDPTTWQVWKITPRRQPRRSSCRARRCGSPTASPSTSRATSSSSTSATTRC